MISAGPPPRLINRARIESSGIELTARQQLTEQISLNFNGMAMDIRDPLGGPPLRQRPRQQASLQLSGNFRQGWDSQIQIKYVDRRFDSSIPTGDVWLPSYATVDASVGVVIRSGRVFVALDNLLARQFDEVIGTAASSRRVRVGVGWRL